MKKYQTEEERKQAKREYNKQHYQANKEKKAEYYQANREKILKQSKQHYQENREKILEQQKQYQQSNVEKIAEYHKQYRQTNKEKIAEYLKTPMGRALNLVNSYKRNDKKYNRGECTLTAKWIIDNIFSQKCIYCGESDWEKLGCDRKDNSLPHTPSNVVCCCGDCNIKRGLKPFEDFLAECE